MNARSLEGTLAWSLVSTEGGQGQIRMTARTDYLASHLKVIELPHPYPIRTRSSGKTRRGGKLTNDDLIIPRLL